MNLKNCKKDVKKNNLLAMELRNQVENRHDVDADILCTLV
jgi:hypothetical protein